MERGYVRIIGGIARRRHLHIPKGRRVRPTSDRVKESLFDILQAFINRSDVLDLFAGSGNLGIEALSRGARTSVFVDRDPECARVIGDNLNRVGLRDRGEILLMDCLSAISSLGGRSRRFSLIFLDPPYGEGWVRKSIAAIHDGGLLEREGLVVAEHSKEELIPERCGVLSLKDQRVYGETMVSFYMNEPDPSSRQDG